jgi:hypothetical protein
MPMSQHLPEEGVEVFIDAARSYCSLIEEADALTRGQFVWQVGERLMRLYAAASALPRTDPTGIEGPEDRSGDAESFTLERRLREKMGDLGRYRRVYDPYDPNETGIEGSLSDDLADIYRDVNEGLRALANGVPRADVVSDWRDSFGHHWGIHAGAALYAIHWITHTAGEEWISPDAP